MLGLRPGLPFSMRVELRQAKPLSLKRLMLLATNCTPFPGSSLPERHASSAICCQPSSQCLMRCQAAQSAASPERANSKYMLTKHQAPLVFLSLAFFQEVLYGYVGTDDYTLDPLIRPGAFVQIDPHQNKVIRGVWPNEHERPVYFVELRDNRYACCWCELEGSHLLLVPSPKSPGSSARSRRSETVGRVVGFAHRIAQVLEGPAMVAPHGRNAP